VGPAIGIGAATTKNRELFWYAEAPGSFAAATVMFCTHLILVGDFNTVACGMLQNTHQGQKHRKSARGGYVFGLTTGKKPVKVPVVIISKERRFC